MTASRVVRPSPISLCDCIAAKTRSETERMRVCLPQIEKKCGSAFDDGCGMVLRECVCALIAACLAPMTLTGKLPSPLLNPYT